MRTCPDRAAAMALLRKYNGEHFHIQHALTVEAVMRWYAENLGRGDEADFWATVGLLHDVDRHLLRRGAHRGDGEGALCRR